MSPLDRRIENAGELADWLAANGHHMRAKQARGIRASLGQFRRTTRENMELRRRLTPIAQARASEARRALTDELLTTAALLERTATIADSSGADQVGLEAPDAAYLADLLRRAVI